jgi:catechol-2,3-dioxygenase
VASLLYGISIAFYFHDPEGNVIEVYWPTELEHPQPVSSRLIRLNRKRSYSIEELKVLTGRKDFTSPTGQEVYLKNTHHEKT